MQKRIGASISLAFALALFSGAAMAEPTRKELRSGAVLIRGLGGDSRFGVYVSNGWGFRTSSYWIEGPTGIVLFDTQFLPPTALEMAKEIEKVTHKKIVTAFVLHPNPDKFNGTRVLQKRGVRVLTSTQVLARIPAVHEDRYESFHERYKPDYPKDAAVPESFGDQSTELEAAGLKIKLHVLGAGASEAHVVAEFEGHLFTGDLIAHRNHSWLEIGKTDEWLRRIDEMKALQPKFVHPGRGESGSAQLLDDEASYLLKVIELVNAENPRANLDRIERDVILENVEKKMIALYPDYGFEAFLGMGLSAEWARQLRAP